MITWRGRWAAKPLRASVAREAGPSRKRWQAAAEERQAERKAEEKKARIEAEAQAAAVDAVTCVADDEAPTTATEFGRLAQKHAREALAEVARLVTGAASEHVRLSAANAVLDRAYGKPLPGAKAYAEGPRGPIEVRWVDPDFP